MARKKKPAGVDLVVARTEAEKSSAPFVQEARQALVVVDRMEITEQTELKTAVGWAAEVKIEAEKVGQSREKIEGPLLKALDELRAFFAPAEQDLVECEKILKKKISAYLTDEALERDRLLTEAGEAGANGHKDRADELMAEADSHLPEKIAGLVIKQPWIGEVTDANKLVAWAIENERIDLLAPDVKTLKALTKAKGGDPRVPGWQVHPRTDVSIYKDKVER